MTNKAYARFLALKEFDKKYDQLRESNRKKLIGRINLVQRTVLAPMEDNGAIAMRIAEERRQKLKIKSKEEGTHGGSA